MKINLRRILSTLTFSLFILLHITTANGQTTSFTYQGKLTDNNVAATAIYDMQFRLYDVAEAGQGAQQGATVTKPTVQATNGIFTAQLDFGAAVFAAGANMYLEIGLRPAGNMGGYTLLAPRQQITSAPYAVRSLNADTADTATDALNLGGTAANQFVVTTDPRLSDNRNPTAGSNFYIQNTTSPQAADISITGEMTANTFDSNNGYKIDGGSVLNTPGTSNLFVGLGAGSANTTGANNAFVGRDAGLSNTIGGDNSFFGGQAGAANTSGANNAFFGAFAGDSNTTGFNNSFFGTNSGSANTTGSQNAFFGLSAGRANTTGTQNAFFGTGAGDSNTTGSQNAFFGNTAGSANTTGADNAFFGTSAGRSNTTGANNAFFGKAAGDLNTTGNNNAFFGSLAGDSNTTGAGNAFFGASAGGANTNGTDNSFFGRSAGLSNTTGGSNAFFGKSAGDSNTTGNANAFFGSLAGDSNTTGGNNAFFGASAGGANTNGGNNAFIGTLAGGNNTTGDNNAFVGTLAGGNNTTGSNNTYIGYNARGGAGVTNSVAIGANAVANQSNGIYLGTASEIVVVPGRILLNGTLTVQEYETGGLTSVCRTFSGTLASCSSSLRYKTNIAPFGSGLNLVNRLQPITFDWKEGGMHDLGLGAEDVAGVEPLLVTYNTKGEVEGVKYDRIGVVLLNAVKEQQTQIEQQQKMLLQQQFVIDGLKKLVCLTNRQADVCQQGEIK